MTRPFYDGVMVLMVPWVTTNRPICQVPHRQTTTNLLCIYSARLDLDSSGGHLQLNEETLAHYNPHWSPTDLPPADKIKSDPNPYFSLVAPLDHSKKNLYTVYPIHINKITWSKCKKETFF